MFSNSRKYRSYTWQFRVCPIFEESGEGCLVWAGSLIYRFIKYEGIPVYIFNSFAFVCWKLESILNANLIKKVLPHFNKSFNKTTKQHKIAFIKFWCYFMIVNSFDLKWSKYCTWSCQICQMAAMLICQLSWTCLNLRFMRNRAE